MSNTVISSQTVKLMEAAPVDWQEMVEAMNDSMTGDIESEIDRLVTRLSILGTYVSERRDGNDHDGAVKRAMKVRKMVRKALGYSYPERQ